MWNVGSCNQQPPGPLVCPQDVQYSDIDYMERQLDFTLHPDFAGLPALISRMKADGMRVILILVSANARGLLGGGEGALVGQALYVTVFPSMFPLEKLRVKKKSMFSRIHRRSAVQVAGGACLLRSFSVLFFSPICCFGFLADLCFGFRTQPFLETRHSPTPRSHGVWRKTSSSRLPTVETSSGERSDLSAGATWGQVTIRVFVPVVI